MHHRNKNDIMDPMKLPSDQLRDAINRCGLNRNQLAIRSGVTPATLSRFVNHKNKLTLDAVDRLAAVLPIKITVGKPGKGK